jgi:PleD family two-component response regulator
MRDLERRHTIMGVDDDEITRDMLSLILSELGNVEFATSGEEALEKVGKIEPDLIILDVQMYEMDGYAVCQRLKADKQTSDIPVVFLTGSNTNEAEELGLDVGATDFIRKPISPKVVLARASNILEFRAATRELEFLAATDSLTGAFNRRRFLEAGNAELRRSKRYKHTFSVLMLDIDHFKAVNDTYGHSVGDTALKETVAVIQDIMRA